MKAARMHEYGKALILEFDEINENIDLLRTGDIVGRAVMKF